MGTAALRVRFRSCPCLQLIAEGIPAAGPELLRAAICFQHQQLPLSRNSSNRGETYTFEILRKELCLARRHGEQQFVVIPAVQPEMYWIVAMLEGNIRSSHLRNACLFQERTDGACGAHAR